MSSFWPKSHTESDVAKTPVLHTVFPVAVGVGVGGIMQWVHADVQKPED